MMDVFFYEAFEEEAEQLKSFLPKNLTAGFSWKTVQEAGDIKPPANLVSIRTQSVLPVSWAENLAGILTRSTGYDHLKQYMVDTGKVVPCGYLPLYCNRAVAEQAMLLWMALLRKLILQENSFHTFKRDGLTGSETQGKTLLVAGVGNIGSEVCKIGAGLGMTVYGVDLVEKYNFVNYMSVEEVLPEADIVVCAMNLNPTSRGYFTYQKLKTAKPGAIFINIARGEMSPSADLLKLIKEGHLGGLGMDVYNQEALLAVSLRHQKTSDNPEVQAVLELVKHPNVIFTPHNAFNTREAVIRKSQQSIQQVESFIKTGHFIWPLPVEEIKLK